jgi:hypothetical protein
MCVSYREECREKIIKARNTWEQHGLHTAVNTKSKHKEVVLKQVHVKKKTKTTTSRAANQTNEATTSHPNQKQTANRKPLERKHNVTYFHGASIASVAIKAHANILHSTPRDRSTFPGGISSFGRQNLGCEGCLGV